MSDLIPGKRYRAVIEGVANEVGALTDGRPSSRHRHGRVIVGCDGLEHGTVEELPDPLPTTADSIVADRFGYAWQRGLTDWQSARGLDARGDDALQADRGPCAVLFDAGATQ